MNTIPPPEGFETWDEYHEADIAAYLSRKEQASSSAPHIRRLTLAPQTPEVPTSGELIVPSPDDPMAVARVFLEERYTLEEDLLLRHHRGDFHRWTGT